MAKIVTMLYPANISNAWPEIEPLIGKVLGLTNTHEAEDVRKSLLSGQSQLWVCWDNGTEAFMVTEFVSYPKGLWLRVWLAGAKEGSDVDWKEMRAEVFKFAELNRCSGVCIEGREGWVKLFPDAKKQAVLLTYSLEIH